MKKFFVFATMAIILVSCNKNEPEQNAVLIGTWSEPYHVNVMVRSITFNADGTARYNYERDTTYHVQSEYSGYYVDFKYSVEGQNMLHCSSLEKPYDYEPFDYKTSFSIRNDTLSVDSICLGTYGYVKSLKLLKL